jgi:ABC-2 type transport system ATP-binding protein
MIESALGEGGMRSNMSVTSEPLIETSRITKRFGSIEALTGLNLRVMPGEIYGLLGSNGAGKTTAIKTILGLLEPTSGWIKVAGLSPSMNPMEVKSKIGYVAENPIVYDSLSPRDFLEFVASVRKVNRVAANAIVSQLSKAFDMGQYFDSPIATLSMGMKQKVALIASFIHQPPILLLDEALNGLDAKSSRIVKDLVLFHAQKGGAALFSTHIMEVAEQICTRIGVIYQGTVIAEGTLDELRGKAGGVGATLEKVFLKLTNEEAEVADTKRMLREAFFKNEDS